MNAAAAASTTTNTSSSFTTSTSLFLLCPICRKNNYQTKQTTVGTLSNLTNIAIRINALVRGFLQRKKMYLQYFADLATANKDSLSRMRKKYTVKKCGNIIQQICHRIDSDEDYINDLINTLDETIITCQNTMADLP
mmetsp:Transcript_28000/g.41292  ORF Transcript_28000/g.41292 Transcript_28000/m.41292 type:complete len:137 (+) Transcript_28000:287-697(+)